MTKLFQLLATLAFTLAFAVPASAQTAAPSPQATLAPSPAAAATAKPAPKNTPRARGKVKKLRSGNLSLGQISYALTHLPQEIGSLRKIKKTSFANLRVQRIPTSLHRLIRTSAADSAIAYEQFNLSDALAQTPAPSGLLGSLLNIIANINISDALNNALNGNNVAVSLSNVLNGNNIAIGQVVGVYVGGGGIITTLIK